MFYATDLEQMLCDCSYYDKREMWIHLAILKSQSAQPTMTSEFPTTQKQEVRFMGKNVSCCFITGGLFL